MKKKHLMVMTAVLLFTMLTALIFSQAHFSALPIYENGVNRGKDLKYIEQEWEYIVGDGAIRYETVLPCVLELPEGAEHLTLYNVIPEDVTDGDVLRLQTQLGVYQVYVNGRLLDETGQTTTEKTYLYDAATAVLFGELKGEDAGKELRIETSNIYPQYLEMQRAPLVGNHRDVLMRDVIGSGLLVILISMIFVVIFLLLCVLFLLKRQRYPVLFFSTIFLIGLILYYNTGNFFRLELWGDPAELFLILMTLFCYGWLFVSIRPWGLESRERLFSIPVFLCICAYLLDYYKSTGVWVPFSKEFTAWFQMELPFMIFLPPALLLYCVSIMLGIVWWIASERAQFTLAAEQSDTQFRLMKAQYAYMEENQSQIRQLRRDMLYHMRVATGLMAEKQTEAAYEYLNRIGERATAPDLGQYCVSRAGNITITWFAREAHVLELSFTVKPISPRNVRNIAPMCALYLPTLCRMRWKRDRW